VSLECRQASLVRNLFNSHPPDCCLSAQNAPKMEKLSRNMRYGIDESTPQENPSVSAGKRLRIGSAVNCIRPKIGVGVGLTVNQSRIIG
jgi:hypothetical protein